MRRYVYVVLMIAATLINRSEASAGVVMLSPVADAMISSANPANNYGGAGAFAISAAGLAKGEFQSLVQFDLSTAKSTFDAAYGAGAWTITAASLQLNVANPNNSFFNASSSGEAAVSWLENDAWNEGVGTPNTPGGSGVTWNALPALLSPNDASLSLFNFNGSTSGQLSIALLPSTGIISDATAGELLSLRLYAPAGETGVAALFNSRTFNTAANRPIFTLEAVPVPEPSSALFATFTVLAWRAMRPAVCRVTSAL